MKNNTGRQHYSKIPQDNSQKWLQMVLYQQERGAVSPLSNKPQSTNKS